MKLKGLSGNARFEEHVDIVESVVVPRVIRRIGQRIAIERKARGWSQRDLSRRTGLTQAYICRIESGRVDVSLSTLVHICTALDTGIDQLLKRIEKLGVNDPDDHDAAHGSPDLVRQWSPE